MQCIKGDGKKVEHANISDVSYDGKFWDLYKKSKPFIKGGQSPRQQ